MNGASVVLLAKRPRAGLPDVTLLAHLRDTERVAARIFSPATRWGRNWLRMFSLTDEDAGRFLLALRIAALFHDLGKANEDFLAAVTGRLHERQALRHEHLSALILHLAAVRTWLTTNRLLDVDVVTAAVLSHHFKASAEGDYAWGQPEGKQQLALALAHGDVRATLERVADVASLSAPPPLTLGRWGPFEPWTSAWSDGMRTAKSLGRAIRGDEARRRILVATKSALIASDAVASALVRENRPIDDWIDDVVDARPLTAQDLETAILCPRAAEIARRTGRPFALHAFQRLAAEQGDRVLLLAPCGAGKTLAAWHWAAAQLAERPLGRIVFLYPTRGTATEGFRDYVAWAPEADAVLLHGTARYELEAMRDNPSEAMGDRRFGRSEESERLFALGLWPYRYFSATVDQFLSVMEHDYSATCLLPVLADAALIVDEVHSFDRHMFEDLIAFLKTFRLPVLLMTATLPPGRRKQLEEIGFRSYPGNDDRAQLADLEAAEGHHRYRIAVRPCVDAVLGEALEAVNRGHRVLWVVNQVGRCQALARTLSERIRTDVVCYHSRFRLQDRQRLHRAVVAAFRDPSRPAVAVTTQVCEMSLDLDADLLITEIAPVPALVQRCGRANRHLARGMDFRATVLAYPPGSAAPYTRDELEAGRRFLDAVAGAAVSQRDLAKALERHAPGEPMADGSAWLLSGGYFAVPGSLRPEESAWPAVLDADLAALRAAVRTRSPWDGFVVSVPRRAVLDGVRPAWLPRYLAVAPAAHYDESLGFLMDDRAETA